MNKIIEKEHGTLMEVEVDGKIEQRYVDLEVSRESRILNIRSHYPNFRYVPRLKENEKLIETVMGDMYIITMPAESHSLNTFDEYEY